MINSPRTTIWIAINGANTITVDARKMISQDDLLPYINRKRSGIVRLIFRNPFLSYLGNEPKDV